MSLIALLLLGIVIVGIYIRIKIGEISDGIRDLLMDTKRMISNPQRIASTIGEAVVDTAINQVEKFTKPKTQTKRAR